MINDDLLVNDGLYAATCRNNGDTTWTYNQGVLLGGLVALARATGDDTYLERARKLADASTTSEALHVDGVLTEPCESSGCDVNGPSFKGIYVRNLGELNRALDDHPYSDYLTDQASTAYDNNRNQGNEYGLHWAGPIRNVSGATQQSAVDLLVAAQPVEDAQRARQLVRVRHRRTTHLSVQPLSSGRAARVFLRDLVSEPGQVGSFSGIEILGVGGVVEPVELSGDEPLTDRYALRPGRLHSAAGTGGRGRRGQRPRNGGAGPWPVPAVRSKPGRSRVTRSAWSLSSRKRGPRSRPAISVSSALLCPRAWIAVVGSLIPGDRALIATSVS